MAKINKIISPFVGNTTIQNNNVPYVDDIFDPLFNTRVKEYYSQLAGNPILGTMSAYEAMLKNALTGQQGILGPGMGVLSTFGRSMDKADDFILGGLTEGVNYLGNLTGGTNRTPVNPITNIFNNDYNYEGTELLAAAGNAMAKLAGTNTPLTSADFNTVGDRVMGTAIDMITDPGIGGGALVRFKPNTPIGEVGQFLSNYDDIMADVAGNLTLPGGKVILNKSLKYINEKLKPGSSANYVDMPLNDVTKQNYSNMATDIANKSGINPIDNPEEWGYYENIIKNSPEYINNLYTKPKLDIKAGLDSVRDNILKNTDTFIKDQDALEKQYLEDIRKFFGDTENNNGYDPKLKTEIENKYLNSNSNSKYIKPTSSINYVNAPEVESFGDLPDATKDAFLYKISSDQKLEDLDLTTIKNIIKKDPNHRSKFIKTYGSLDSATDNDFSDYYYYIKSNLPKEDNEFVYDPDDPFLLALYYKNNTAPSKLMYSKGYDPTENPYVLTIPNAPRRAHSKLSQHYVDTIQYALKQFEDNDFTKLKTTIDASKLNKLVTKDDIKSLEAFVNSFDKVSSKDLESLLSIFKRYEYDEKTNDYVVKGLIPAIFKNRATLELTDYGNNLLDMAEFINKNVFSIEDKLKGFETFIDEAGNVKVSNKISLNQILENSYQLNSNPKDIVNLVKGINDNNLPLVVSMNPRFTGDYNKYNTFINKVYKALKDSGHKNYTEKAFYPTRTNIYKQINKDISNTYINYSNIITPSSIKTYKNTIENMKKLDSETFVNVITTPISKQELKVNAIMSDTFSDFSDRWGVEPTKENILNLGTPEEKRWFTLIDKAKSTTILNKLGAKKGIEEIPEYKKIVENVRNVSRKHTKKDVIDYLTLNSKRENITIKGQDMLKYLIGSGGSVEISINTKTKHTSDIKNLLDTINSNIKEVNKYGDILVPIDFESNGIRHIGYRFNDENIKIKQNLSKIYGLINKDLSVLQDMEFQKGDSSIIIPKQYQDIDSVFSQSRDLSTRLSKMLGFKDLSDNYIKHAMLETEDSAVFWKGIDDACGISDINRDNLNKIQEALSDLDISERLQFGTIPLTRSHLGDFTNYVNGYETDLNNIITSTFTKGMFDNTNVQTFFNLYLTDNFKVSSNFKDLNSLKKLLFTEDAQGAFTGNLYNTSIAVPKFNAEGKLTGFKRLDKFNDIELNKIFTDGEYSNAVILPDSVFGELDRLCKKNVRMSNKVYRFINKYLTVPFKFGTLANPGFLVGNIEDAYFKQAVTMSNKYNTPLAKELSNVAMSMRQVVTLNNLFVGYKSDEGVFGRYLDWLRNVDLNKVSTTDKPADWAKNTFGLSKAKVDELTPDLVLGNPKYSKAWISYLNSFIDKDDLKIAKLYTFINSYENVTMFNKDIEDMFTLDQNINKYNISTNLVERVFYGQPKNSATSKFSTYGLFLNNPVSNKILKSSNEIETLMRSTSIINDLKHKGLSLDEINKILNLPKEDELKLYENLHVSMEEAVNTMNAANFDYNNVTEIMDKASYILPFPTFYLKNIGFWANIFCNKPQLIDNVITVHEGLWSGRDTEDEFLAEAKGRGAVPFGDNNKHIKGIIKQTPYNSMFGAFNAVNNLKEDFAYRTNPALRVLFNKLQDPKDIKYRPYSTNPYEKNIIKGNPNFNPIEYQLHQMNPYERTINTYLRTPTKMANNTWQVSDFLPSMFQPDFSKKK